MSVAEDFSQFLSNLAISNSDTISLRYGELTAALNKRFRDTESKTSNTLQVGSFGRRTGIDGMSDLDMLYIMPKSAWATYGSGKQLKLLQDVRGAILERYPRTDVRVDRLVVTVTYSDFHVEVQPVFEDDDGHFTYPDTKGDGAWKLTKPRSEMAAISDLDTGKNSNLRRLCKMARAWRNKHGVGMGGLLIDTLAYNFLAGTQEYDEKSYLYYDYLCRDFFEHLSALPSQERYLAPGSQQHVKVKQPFQRKAKRAYELSLEAIAAEGTKAANEKWRKLFGRPFPLAPESLKEDAAVKTATWTNTEEFIEDRFPIDIRHTLRIDCDVKQSGFREHGLRWMLAKAVPLLARKALEFRVVEVDVPGEYYLLWKVLNRGDEARKRNLIRGQIVPDGGHRQRTETTSFRGEHVVECYAVRNGVVVAKDRILVPITTNA